MKNYNKYSRGYFMPSSSSLEWTKKEFVETAPVWCSVDLRDGNQALIVPMTLEQKVSFFKYLVELGFKEIEIGFPAASKTEFDFTRKLIDENLIPDDVYIQVLTQAREHIIEKTFAAVEGAKNVIVHLYNSTSPAQREQVFGKTKEQIKEIAIKGAKLFNDYKAKTAISKLRFEYSPESFSATEPEYALEICNDVLDIWKPSKKGEVIINLPSTVELALPHIFASQIEYVSTRLKYRENVSVSIHAHNDRGTAVASTELALLAGADRVEGTLFGNGERTGNCDIVTVAMNLYMQGIDPKLDFSNISKTVKIYEEYTDMTVNPRSPYAGELVFAAFSGSHQDAIAKGLKFREDGHTEGWNVPYLAIDPSDVGRVLETDVVRINSQSGKGGVGYVLERAYGIKLSAKFREVVGYAVKDYADTTSSQLSTETVYNTFYEKFVNTTSPNKLISTEINDRERDKISIILSLERENTTQNFTGIGNGRIDAAANALKSGLGLNFSIVDYAEHTLSGGQNAKAFSYIEISDKDGNSYFGAGTHTDIAHSGLLALISAVNNIS